MDRIQKQASKIWDLLFANETAATYQKALNLTGTLLTELAQLVWLIVCSGFVFGAWVGDASMKAGQNIREWVDQQRSGVVRPTSEKSVTATGKSLLDKGRDGAAYLLNQAREQLGLESAPLTKPISAQTAPVSIPPQPAPPTPTQSAPPEPTQPPVAAVPEQHKGYGSAQPPGNPVNEPLSERPASERPASERPVERLADETDEIDETEEDDLPKEND